MRERERDILSDAEKEEEGEREKDMVQRCGFVKRKL